MTQYKKHATAACQKWVALNTANV